MSELCTLYTAGPMTGIPHFNIPAFDDAAEDLRVRGHFVVSPAELDDEATREACLASEDGDPASVKTGDTWGDFLSRDVKLIADGYGPLEVQIDGIAVLPGWETSKGARLEVHIARQLDKPIFLYNAGGAFDDNWGFTRLTRRLIDGINAWTLIEMDDAELDFWFAKSDPTVQAKIKRAEEAWAVIDADDDGAEFLRPADVIVSEGGRTNIRRGDEARAQLEAYRKSQSDCSSIRIVSSQTTNDGEVRVVDPDTGGEKGSKLARFDLIPPLALEALAEHYGRGAEKYEDRNWERGYNWSLSYAAMQRHLNAWWGGETDDPETGSNHLTAAAWHCFALLEFDHTHPEKDDRP